MVVSQEVIERVHNTIRDFRRGRYTDQPLDLRIDTRCEQCDNLEEGKGGRFRSKSSQDFPMHRPWSQTIAHTHANYNVQELGQSCA